MAVLQQLIGRASDAKLMSNSTEATDAGAIRSAVPIEHSIVEVNGARLHVARTGRGRPLLLLHGWPEFWLSWEPVMTRLSDRFELIAPDLRGFGASDKPAGKFGPSDQANDIAALIDELGVGPVGIVSHDVGASVAQALAPQSPERIAGLFFFNFFYPGIGDRFFEPAQLQEVWHTFFNQSDLAPVLIGASPENIRLFFSYFLKQWAHREEAFDDALLDAFIANFQTPGNVDGGFAYYRTVSEQRDQNPAPIRLPTCVRWTECDPALRFDFSDRLPEFFTDLDFAPFPDAGHFPQLEQPDRAADEIARFFQRIDQKGWLANADAKSASTQSPKD